MQIKRETSFSICIFWSHSNTLTIKKYFFLPRNVHVPRILFNVLDKLLLLIKRHRWCFCLSVCHMDSMHRILQCSVTDQRHVVVNTLNFLKEFFLRGRKCRISTVSIVIFEWEKDRSYRKICLEQLAERRNDISDSCFVANDCIHRNIHAFGISMTRFNIKRNVVTLYRA